jgi:hypothetical protein
MIQGYCMEQIGYNSVIQQEYDRITKKEELSRITQITIYIYTGDIKAVNIFNV